MTLRLFITGFSVVCFLHSHVKEFTYGRVENGLSQIRRGLQLAVLREVCLHHRREKQ